MKALSSTPTPNRSRSTATMKDLSVETPAAATRWRSPTSMRCGSTRSLQRRLSRRAAGPGISSIAAEQTCACEKGNLASTSSPSRRSSRAEILILQFPIWWFVCRAILKGWADRESRRARLRLRRRTQVRHRHARGKTAMIAATTGTSADTYTPDGIDGDINTVLWPVHNGLPDIAASTSLNFSSPTCRGVSARRFVSATRRLQGAPSRYRTRAAALSFSPRPRLRPERAAEARVIARSGVQRNV